MQNIVQSHSRDVKEDRCQVADWALCDDVIECGEIDRNNREDGQAGPLRTDLAHWTFENRLLMLAVTTAHASSVCLRSASERLGSCT